VVVAHVTTISQKRTRSVGHSTLEPPIVLLYIDKSTPLPLSIQLPFTFQDKLFLLCTILILNYFKL
jgi:hypothetical protein